jgi:uncharacterized iron-regulated membrane protein
MRIDGKSEGLRQAMSWFHTWSGLLLGWLLYAVFLTGTLSFFVDEINAWMRPELHRSVPQPDTAQRAVDGMARLAPDATTWTLTLPNERQNAVEASWRKPGAAAGRAGTERAMLDAATGDPITVRDTRAGSFLYRFHFELHAMPRVWGRWIVGIATLVMFAAILSGVVTHKKIFIDFFTFRRNKGQRSWLDAHNATAVLALPLHIVITFSGLLLLMNMLMPFPKDAVYKGDNAAFFAEFRGQAPAAQGQSGQGGAGQAEGGEVRGGEGRSGGGRRGNAAVADGPVPLTAIAPLMAQARAAWPDREVGTIVITRPGAPGARIELREDGGRKLTERGGSRKLVFDGRNGALLEQDTPPPPSAIRATYNVMTSLHLGRFAGPAMRWALFIGGIIGTLMVATGMVLWVVKRLPERRKLGATPKGHRLVEVLNVAGIAGLPVAIGAYFHANRLIAATFAQRSAWEVNTLFIVWLACLVHAAVRPHRSAWREQLALAAGLFVFLPILNALTGGAGLMVSVPAGLWAVAGVDAACLVMGALLAFAAYRLRGGDTGAVAARTPGRKAEGGNKEGSRPGRAAPLSGATS